MIQRCYNPKDNRYPYYGARGITVCPEWKESVQQFTKDMGDRPNGQTIDRIDNDGPYCPKNCRWTTKKEQALNRRNTIFIMHNGTKLSLTEYANATGFSYDAARWHFRQGHLHRV